MNSRKLQIEKSMIPVLLLLLFGSFYTELEAKEIKVTDFGAVANDGKDDTKALRKAVAYCVANPGTTLLIPPGTYMLKDADAVKLEQDALAGKFGPNPELVIYTPYYPYSKGLDLSGCKDITIVADGATLLCEGWMEPVSIDHSTNFTLKGLTIDYKRKPFSSGDIIAIESDYFDVQFSSERTLNKEMPLMRMTIWDKKKNKMYPEPIYYPKKDFLGNNIVRIYYRIPKELLGANAGILHCFHFRPAILIHESKNTVIENVTIHSQAGMGIVGFDSKDILIKGLQVVPASGYYISTNTDATHFACCEGLLRFEGCVFQGQGDDATNVHGYYQSIVSAAGNEATLQVKAQTYTHAQVLDAPRAGDVLELVEINTLKPVKEYTVEKVGRNEKSFTSSVVLSDSLPADFTKYYLMNITKLPRLEFVNSTINSHLARGILVKTRNVLIDNNVFRNCTGTAIHVGAESGWHEGTHAKNVTISNNTMIGCGKGGGSQAGASGIAVIIEAKDTYATYLHDNITIENNTIVGDNNECGIYIGNASHVTLKNNHISNCKKDLLVHSATGINTTSTCSSSLQVTDLNDPDTNKAEERYILTPPPPLTPRINGAKIVGASPNKPFLFTIATTGERPMTFIANDLPEGLTLDKEKGIITGSCKHPGTYIVPVAASNTKGTCKDTLEIVIGRDLALTPHMGWNSWYIYATGVTQDIMEKSAQAMYDEGLVNFGYTFVNIDDGWEIKAGSDDPVIGGPVRNSDGTIRTNKNFPDMKRLTTYIHNLGMKAGLYSSPGRTTCGGYAGSFGHEAQDIQTFSDWGFDFLKYDWCSYENEAKSKDLEELKKPYLQISKLCRESDRDIVLNMCQYGMGDVWKWGKEVGGNSWRTTYDIGDTKDLIANMFKIGFFQEQLKDYSGPGGWNDPDYLLFGNIYDWDKKKQKLSPYSASEHYTCMTLWCMMSAPLIFSGEITTLDDFTKNILCNAEVIDINQDKLGKPGYCIRNENGIEIWKKELSDGTTAIAIFNKRPLKSRITLNWKDLGYDEVYEIRDLWRQVDLGTIEKVNSFDIPRHGCVLLRIK